MSASSVMQDIENSADLVLTGSVTGADISAKAPLMSAASPMTIVVNGNLNLSGWHNSGFGLLLVTGTLYYDPDASWNGIVLVVGQAHSRQARTARRFQRSRVRGADARLEWQSSERYLTWAALFWQPDELWQHPRFRDQLQQLYGAKRAGAVNV